MQQFKAFEQQTCPITSSLEELDPIYGFSLDGMAAKVRRRELSLPFPWALTTSVGFETRFHGKRVCNFFFESLPKGYTRGNHLVNFSECVAWMRNLGKRVGDICKEGQEPFRARNWWYEFLKACLRDIKPCYLVPTEDDDGWFTFEADALLNSQWYSVCPPTAAGCVIDVPDVFSGTQKPVEIPVTFRDLDYLWTQQILNAHSGAGFSPAELWKAICEKSAESLTCDGKLEPLKRLIENGEQFPGVLSRYTNAGHGFLGILKGEFPTAVSIPQLELRTDALSS